MIFELFILFTFHTIKTLEAVSSKECLALTYTTVALIFVNNELCKRSELQISVNYIQPLLEEIFRIILIFFTPAVPFLHGLWLILGTSLEAFEYSLRGYDTYYSEFLGAYKAFINHQELNLTLKRTSIYKNFAGELEDDIESLTLTSNGSDFMRRKSMIQLPLTKTFDPSVNSLKKTKSIPVVIESDPKQQQMLIDKLYSVSPGDTYHLDEDTANVLMLQNEAYLNKLDCNRSQAFDNILEVDDPLYSYDLETSKMFQPTRIRPGSDSNSDSGLLESNLCPSFEGNSLNYDNSSHDKERKISKSHWYKYVDWLFPISLLMKPSAIKVSERLKLLRKKLSCYTLNSTKDDESSDKFNDRLHESGEYDKYFLFRKYLESYFDISSSNKGIPIDPIFKKYNVLLVDVPIFYALLDLLDCILWNFTVFLIALFYHLDRNLFFLLFTGCIVLKFFKKNFLRAFILNYKSRLLLYLLMDILSSISLYICMNFTIF